MDRTREEFWQEAWRAAGLATARRDPAREKFYALVAYPGPSGFLHIGHLRGPAYADAIHRFHRMRGRQVFFPTGTHASGLPAVTFAQKVRDREPGTVAQLEDHGVPPEMWTRLEEPVEAARFLGRSYLEVFRRLGLLIDESAYVTTIDEDYQAFIRWQFHQLHERGALVQAPHYAPVCPVCGPVSVDASETDLSSGGDAEIVNYQTVPFHLDDGRVLLAATLRPETVFGATNVWIHPTEPLVVWHHAAGEFLVGRRVAPRLVEQHGGRVGHELAPGELAGRTAHAPLTDVALPVLASPMVDPAIGTGVVMSVPAHAPADWIAVTGLASADRGRLAPVVDVVVVADGASLSASEAALVRGPGHPAERALRSAGARSADDTDAVEIATSRLYRLEHTRGRMRADLLDGASVPQARDEVTRRLRALPGGLELKEFSKPVICRNGHEVVIRQVPDQWFIHYSDAQWKTESKKLVARMRFWPPEYGAELPSIVDWYADRPCTRRGRWLGTAFPDDPSWVIEPIADSTFYPAYFIVRRLVASGRVRLEQLTDAFFDHVFLGKGSGEPSLDPALQAEARAEFTYWYPLDVNFGGKEHKRVHFPVFLATHALLLPPELQPKGIFVNWWVTDRGEKLSKKRISSKGGAIPPIRSAFQRWSADALRLFYCQAASPFQDFDWEPDLVDAALARLNEIEQLAYQVSPLSRGGPPELDAWLESAWRELLVATSAAFTDHAVRTAAELVYVRVPTMLRRYLARGGTPGAVTHRLLGEWVRLMSPITPHLAEELGLLFGDPLVAERAWPVAEAWAANAHALASESYLELVEDDLRAVAKLAWERGEKPTAVSFFVAAPWKREIEGWIRAATAGGRPLPPMRELMARAEQHPELAAYRESIPAYIQRVAPVLRRESGPASEPVDELGLLKSAEAYLARRFNLERVDAYPELEAEAHDPSGRRERARPGKPAFYLVVPGRSPSATSA